MDAIQYTVKSKGWRKDTQNHMKLWLKYHPSVSLTIYIDEYLYSSILHQFGQIKVKATSLLTPQPKVLSQNI